MTDFGFTEAELLELEVDDYEESGGKPEEKTRNESEERYNSHSYGEGVESNEKAGGGFGDPVSREELDAYERNAEALVTKRIIIVYRTEEEENTLKRVLGLSDDQNLGVVYNASEIKV